MLGALEPRPAAASLALRRVRGPGARRRGPAADAARHAVLSTPGEELGLVDADVPLEERVDPGGRDGSRAPLPWDGSAAHGWPADPWLRWPPESATRNADDARPGSRLAARALPPPARVPPGVARAQRRELAPAGLFARHARLRARPRRRRRAGRRRTSPTRPWPPPRIHGTGSWRRPPTATVRARAGTTDFSRRRRSC